MIRKRLVVSMIAAGLLMLLLWIFWVPVETAKAGRLLLTDIQSHIEVENFAALPQGESETVTVESDSAAYGDIAAAIARLRCHRCIHTIRDETIPDGTGQREILVKYGENSLMLEEGAEHIWLNGRVYRAAGAAALYALCRDQFTISIA